MTDIARRRPALLVAAALCCAVVVILAVLVRDHWTPLQQLDTALGTDPESFTYSHHWARTILDVVALVFGTIGMSLLTLATALALIARRQRRAAAWAVVVMLVVSLGTSLLKTLVGRHRPVWDHPVVTLTSLSFPSGHASGIAGGVGIAVVLAVLLVRRRSLRRWVISTAMALGLLVGADRILLGVHNLSDVLAGYAFGALVVLVSLILFDPTPRSLALSHQPLAGVPADAERRLGVVFNPSKVEDGAGFRSRVEEMARDGGWGRVTWWQTTETDTGYAMAHAAAVDGSAMVLAVGGDGTIRAVCEELAGTGVAVGIVPAGTGNLLARNLGIPLNFRGAVDVALHGQDRAVDLVQVAGDQMPDSVYLVMAGMGFDAAIMEGVNEDFKTKVGWLAYVWSAMKSLMYPVMGLEVCIDDGPFTSARARTVVIGNVGTLQAGMPLLPDAAIDDGVLDVVLLYPRRFLSWLPLAVRVLSKDKRTDETITRMTGRRVVVRASADVPRQLDGDLIAPGRELRAECLPGRLLVRVPR